MDAETFKSGKKNLRIQKYPDTCGRSLSNKARIFGTWLALSKVTLVTRNLWRKLRDMSAFTTVIVKISKTKTKRLTAGKNRGEI